MSIPKGRIRLLHYFQCLVYLHFNGELSAGQRDDEQIIEHTIKYGPFSKIEHLAQTVDYPLNVSTESFHMVLHNNTAPFAEILWAANYCIHDRKSLKLYLHAELLYAGLSEQDILTALRVSKSQFNDFLEYQDKVSMQFVDRLARLLHAPCKPTQIAFKHANFRIYDEVKRVPVVAKFMNGREALKSFFRGFAYFHGRTLHWIAAQTGHKYKDLITIIKSNPASMVVASLRKLPDIFNHQVTLHDIAEILNGKWTPQHELVKKAFRSVHDRRSLLKYVYTCIYVHGVSLNDVTKAIGQGRGYLRSAILRNSRPAVVLTLAKVTRAIGVKHPVPLKNLVRDARITSSIHEWPKQMRFYIHYSELPDDTKSDAKDYIFDANQAKYHFKIAKNRQSMSQYATQIIGAWSGRFDFLYDKFMQDNFVVGKNHIVTTVKQRKHSFPLSNKHDWKKTLHDIYAQLKATDSGLDKSIRSFHENSPYAKYVFLDGIDLKSLAKPDDKTIAKLDDGHKHLFTGRFAATGVRTIHSTDKRHKDYYRPILVLKNLRHDHKIVLSEVAFNYTKSFVKLGLLRPGDLVQVFAMVHKYKTHGDKITHLEYGLNYPNRVKLIRRKHVREAQPVPMEIHALTGYAVMNSNSMGYDFTQWGDNYGYIRFCKHQYSVWKSHQKHDLNERKGGLE